MNKGKIVKRVREALELKSKMFLPASAQRFSEVDAHMLRVLEQNTLVLSISNSLICLWVYELSRDYPKLTTASNFMLSCHHKLILQTQRLEELTEGLTERYKRAQQ